MKTKKPNIVEKFLCEFHERDDCNQIFIKKCSNISIGLFYTLPLINKIKAIQVKPHYFNWRQK